MSFFRRKIDAAPETARLAKPGDRVRIDRFMHTAERRFLTSDLSEVAGLFQRDPTAVLESDGRLTGVASFGWRTPPVAWLRTILLQGQSSAGAALRALSEPLYAALRHEGYTLAAITLDEWNDPWLRGPLRELGYRPMVEVVGYEKHHLSAPAHGNRVVTIRRAQPTDLPAVLELDAACFPLPWIKGAEILAPAIRAAPCFLVAEFSAELVGYAFLTGHQGGRLFHLVRVAVAPAYRGRAIGVRLLAEIVDYCASRYADLLTLNTQADNRPAQRLYEWFGFVRSGERQTVLGREIGETAGGSWQKPRRP